jgi:integrase
MLTELTIKQLVPREKAYALQDGQGLILDVQPGGKKYWIIRYWINGKEKRTSIGTHPQLSLREARIKNMEFRKSLKSGKPLGLDSETFSAVAEEWVEKRMVPVSAESYLRTIRLRLKSYIFPFIGHMKLRDITSGIVLQTCRRIEEKGVLETASRVKQIIGQVFNYAIATDRAETNPTLALHGALQRHTKKHYAALIDPDKIGMLMRQIDNYPYDIVRCALKFSALTFCRPGEIRSAEWKEINWEKNEWQIPGEKMKTRRPHIVPLVRQTLGVLEELKLLTGTQKWLFPSARNDGRCMSENAVRMAIRTMGYGNKDMTAHGFRGMASTILNDHRFPPDHVEIQLAHAAKNAVRAAYNHAEYLPQRREMMEWYANWMDEMKNKEKTKI